MSLVMMALLLLLLLLSVGITGSAVTEVSKVCRGTSEALSTSGDTKFRYNRYKNAYTNCTYIEGNLEITFLDNSTNYDLSFLENIQEVTGYVLIVAVYTDYLPLTKLRIIRGRELFMYNDSGYSLYIAINNKIFSKKVGLKELRFVSLSEIITGKVMFMNNDLLCFENTIFWSDISTKEQPPVTFSISANHEKQKCGECDASCYQETTGKRHCWGLGPSMCQKLSHGKVCSESCDNRCFGKLPNQCCHPECASGCTGPKKTNCLACRNFFNDGECVPFCPNIKIYDNKKYKWIENPDARYTYGSLCVKDCPEHMLKDEGACVKTCPSNKLPINNTCLFCKGPCPKRCKGNQNSDYVTAMTLSTFKDCTVIEGSLKILTPTFDGDKYNNISGVTQEEMNVFSTVKEITGFLMVQSLSNQSENLSFLRSLEVIGGRDTHNTGTSMNIYVKYMTSLELTSLKKIKNGNVIIKNNKNLCFADTINFKKLFSSDRQQAIVEKNGNKEDCEKANEVCDKECSSDGCWGKGPTKCLSCKHYHVENTTLCIASCSSKPRLYDAGRNICSQCHSECANNCTGPNLDECDSCLNVKDGPNCRNKCPPSKYPDKSKICQMCHETCANGCSGPHNEVRWGGCKSCEIGIEQKQGRILCLSKNIESCPSGYYRSFAEEKSPMSGKQLCKQCHSDCKTCNGPGTPFCDECRHFKLSGRCYKDCPGLHYGDPVTKLCKHCHTECINGCTGPTASDCFACKYFKVYTNDNNTQFNCTDKCPEHKQYLVKDDQTKDSGKTLCADKTHPEVVADLQETEREERKKLIIIISSVSGSIVVVLALMVIACHYWRQRARAQENTAKLTARMTGFEETEPLTPTNVKPDLAQLRLIKESELRRGGIIGSGAFGTVYKGFWIPKGENVKIPVAIKVLQEGTSPSQNKELLEEARVMASVDQQCCIRILAVCMTAQMMLITQLMPLGCLLDYVRKNKDNIGSKALLNWCMQIARGMTYLEERAIVHRDLAARNVLLQSPGQVKITDFGLAKLLDYNEDEYHAAGGKMPIKWLALECIQHRIFTHKSDVWSYGVTVWELFTYGQRPYENIRARDVPDLLEKGERLPQPSICTIDVYMIMIKCWMLDADSRPGFKELAEEFAKMARDPGRYLVIRGDKLMRLPSLSYDKDALLRSLSVATDGPEELMEADDYLQPQSAREQPSDNNNGASKRHGSTTADFASLIPTTDRQEKEADPPNRRREKRYGHLESAAAAKQQRQLEPSRGREDSVNSRYSSDPIKILPNVKEKDEVPESRLFLPESPPEADLKKKMKKPFYSPALQLPLDEDDYLQPKSANPAAYMDLIDGKDNIPNDMQQMDNGKFPLKNMPMVSVENPEYFGDEDQENWESNKPSIMEEALSQPESNNFDYYNDVTKLEKMKREMQPLIIDDPNSETMV